jgi:hypothetical protein
VFVRCECFKNWLAGWEPFFYVAVVHCSHNDVYACRQVFLASYALNSVLALVYPMNTLIMPVLLQLTWLQTQSSSILNVC